MRGLLVDREFRSLAASEFLSVVGDQMSKVALALIVFERSGSAALTGLTYALTAVPTVLGGLLLASIADRYPRQKVLITIDGARCLAVLSMAVPGLPLPVLCCLVFVSSLLRGPYSAAHLALLRDVLPQSRYASGMAVRQSFGQTAQLIGFASGGAVIALIGPRACLAVDGLTFAMSAGIVLVGVRARAASATIGTPRFGIEPLRIVWSAPGRRAIFLVTFLGLFLIGPEAITAPLVSALQLDPIWISVYLGGIALSSVIALPLVAPILTPERVTTTLPLACLAPGAVLAVLPLSHNPYWVLLLFGLSGALWSVVTVMAVSSLAEMLPDHQRAQGMGLASSMNLTAQGLGAALSGLVAEWTGPLIAIAALGVGGVLFAYLPVRLWLRSTSERGAIT